MPVMETEKTTKTQKFQLPKNQKQNPANLKVNQPIYQRNPVFITNRPRSFGGHK